LGTEYQGLKKQKKITIITIILLVDGMLSAAKHDDLRNILPIAAEIV